ncbi:uncharacterized protein TNIN_27561 [Trichonephila inaurata madagascariensis]|uniref:Uncharacterized protein n=1 Tax=Trichonephila inaurata madagascariensis TaxID=2747483 RepID=A0A8X6YHL7_9ARAC|nr:uncharacterized protein TNIN_27561 [Trichonephila inaurata madagascariensis]
MIGGYAGKNRLSASAVEEGRLLVLKIPVERLRRAESWSVFWKFCVKLGKTGKQTYAMIKEAYGSDVFELFREGRGRVEVIFFFIDLESSTTTRTNSEFYVEVLTRPRKRIVRVRPANWRLRRDNARSHTAFRVLEYLASTMWQRRLIPHSPDFTPPDIPLFPRIKSSLKGKHYGSVGG